MIERKRTTAAKVLKNWPARGSFTVYATSYGHHMEIVKIETHRENARITEGYVNLVFKIVPGYDDQNIREAKERRSTFIGRCYGPMRLNDPELWYEPRHAALQSRVDALLETNP